MRRAKIVATVGPACSAPGMLEKLLEHGLDVARLNFSHGRHEDHAQVLDRLRAASRHLGKAVAVLQDLQGPKIRTGPLKAGRAGVTLVPGAEIVITTEGELVGDEKLVSTTYPHLAEDVRPGDRLLIDDGLIELRVLASDGVRARAEVVEGGWLGEHKGINLPGVALRAEAMSDKDKADLAFGISHGVDYVALSFVRSPEDIALCRSEMERAGRVVPIIAKIEKPEALERMDAIIAAADGLMVARGDLGVEILPERVPLIQKEISRKGNAAGKPVIIATQMLNSMIDHPRPTRAEASDVANAIWDGADAVMLSGETASGKHPLLAVQMMDRIVREAEAAVRPHEVGADRVEPGQASVEETIAGATVTAVRMLGAVAVAVFTKSGFAARIVAARRPGVPIVAFTDQARTYRQLAMVWGVTPVLVPHADTYEQMAAHARGVVVDMGVARPGDRVVMTAGVPFDVPGTTNTLKVETV